MSKSGEICLLLVYNYKVFQLLSLGVNIVEWDILLIRENGFVGSVKECTVLSIGICCSLIVFNIFQGRLGYFRLLVNC